MFLQSLLVEIIKGIKGDRYSQKLTSTILSISWSNCHGSGKLNPLSTYLSFTLRSANRINSDLRQVPSLESNDITQYIV